MPAPADECAGKDGDQNQQSPNNGPLKPITINLVSGTSLDRPLYRSLGCEIHCRDLRPQLGPKPQSQFTRRLTKLFLERIEPSSRIRKNSVRE